MSACPDDPDAEDVWFEECIAATNKVYEVKTSASDPPDTYLLPLLQYSCAPLPHKLLNSKASPLLSSLNKNLNYPPLVLPPFCSTANQTFACFSFESDNRHLFIRHCFPPCFRLHDGWRNIEKHREISG